MKKLERIFLYSVLAILFFYVFFVDGNVESQIAIQEEIRARRIVIMNDAGQAVVILWANEDGGAIDIGNKAGTSVASMGVYKDDGRIGVSNKAGIMVSAMGVIKDAGFLGIRNKANIDVVLIEAYEDNGAIEIRNKDDTPVVSMVAYKDDGLIEVSNRRGKVIGSLPQNYNDNKEEVRAKLEKRLPDFWKEKLNKGRAKGETSKLLEVVLEEKRREIIKEWIDSGRINNISSET